MHRQNSNSNKYFFTKIIYRVYIFKIIHTFIDNKYIRITIKTHLSLLNKLANLIFGYLVYSNSRITRTFLSRTATERDLNFAYDLCEHSGKVTIFNGEFDRNYGGGQIVADSCGHETSRVCREHLSGCLTARSVRLIIFDLRFGHGHFANARQQPVSETVLEINVAAESDV